MTTLPNISFEFFPTSDAASADRLWDVVNHLGQFAPRFVSITYGAAGSDRDRTDHLVRRIKEGTDLDVAAHLTCVAATRQEIDQKAEGWWDAGIKNIVALRGDPQGEDTIYRPQPDGYENAADLVQGLRRIADFDISVAAYPEIHPDSSDLQADLDNLKRKIDAGANRAITQFFFDADTFLRFRDRAQGAGITAPLIPGILPVTNFARTVSFAEKCGTVVPEKMRQLFDGLENDPETSRLVAAATACELCETLQAEGVNDFHFYTLNRAELSSAICRRLGIRPEISKAA